TPGACHDGDTESDVREGRPGLGAIDVILSGVGAAVAVAVFLGGGCFPERQDASNATCESTGTCDAERHVGIRRRFGNDGRWPRVGRRSRGWAGVWLRRWLADSNRGSRAGLGNEIHLNCRLGALLQPELLLGGL